MTRRARLLLLALLGGPVSAWAAAQPSLPPSPPPTLTPAPMVAPVVIKSGSQAAPTVDQSTLKVPATPPSISPSATSPVVKPTVPAEPPSGTPAPSPATQSSGTQSPAAPAPATTPAEALTPLPAAQPADPVSADSGADQPDTGNNDPTEHEKAGRCVEGSEQACMALSRQGKDGKERRILVVRTGTSDDTGIYTVCSPRDDEPADAPNVGVFSESGPGGIRITIDKNVIRVPLAMVTQKPPKDGQEGSDGRVEASAGTARFLEQAPAGAKDRLSLCGVASQPKPVAGTVYVTQGKTRLRGQKLVYDETDGVARIDGPITFRRDNDKDPLSGSSQSIEVNVDAEKTVLVGDVVLRSQGGRISKAARVEYDDARNEARLYATQDNPAESVKGGDVLRLTDGSIVYNLDTNEVYVVKAGEGNISGEFQEGGETDLSATASSSGPSADPHKSRADEVPTPKVSTDTATPPVKMTPSVK